MIEISAIAKIIGKPIVKESIPILKKIMNRASNYFSDNILIYYQDRLNKYGKTKTLLYRQPTDFYKIYYPIRIELSGEDVNSNSVHELFSKHNFVTIIGDAGSGKSTFIKHLFMSCLVEGEKLPINIILRDLDKETNSLDIYIRKHVLNNKLAADDESITKLLKKGQFVFFLDGYDEIKSDVKNAITSNIENFIDSYSKNYFLLASRPYSNIESFKRFYNYNIQELSRGDVNKFISQQIQTPALASKIIESVTGETSKHIESFLRNPLLLTLYILTYSKNSKIPSSKYIFYRRVFDVLFSEHDSSSKIGFEREIKTKLNQEEFEYVLEMFSFISFFSNDYNFSKQYIFKQLSLVKEKNNIINFSSSDFICDMQLSIGIWTEDSGEYSFSHRSLQEYFCAMYLSKMKNSNKSKVFDKIIKMKVAYDRESLYNFLSLCYEIDENVFINYYSIPSIKYIRKEFFKIDGSINYNMHFIRDRFDGSLFSASRSFRKISECTMYPNFTFMGYVLDIAETIRKHKNHPNYKLFFNIGKQSDISFFTIKGSAKIDDIQAQEFFKEIGVEDIYIRLSHDLDIYISNLENIMEKEQNTQSSIIDLM